MMNNRIIYTGCSEKVPAEQTVTTNVGMGLENGI